MRGPTRNSYGLLLTASMPSGVEHTLPAARPSFAAPLLLTASMPSGVEHQISIA